MTTRDRAAYVRRVDLLERAVARLAGSQAIRQPVFAGLAGVLQCRIIDSPRLLSDRDHSEK